MTTVSQTLPFKPKPSHLSMEIVRVSPSMAEKMLGRNTRNRSLNQRQVTRWAQSMTAGEWLVTGEAIKIASTGDLLDGQHRLAAVIESGCTVLMLVVKGLHPETQDVMDTGRARTLGLFYKDSKLRQTSYRQILDFTTG